jgi:hypothetical protein
VTVTELVDSNGTVRSSDKWKTILAVHHKVCVNDCVNHSGRKLGTHDVSDSLIIQLTNARLVADSRCMLDRT